MIKFHPGSYFRSQTGAMFHHGMARIMKLSRNLKIIRLYQKYVTNYHILWIIWVLIEYLRILVLLLLVVVAKIVVLSLLRVQHSSLPLQMRSDIRKRGFEPVARLSNAMAHYLDQRQQIRFSNIYRGCRKYFILHVLAACIVVYLLYAIGGGTTFNSL